MREPVYYKTKKITINALIHLLLLSVTVTCLFPLLWMVSSSLKTQDTIFKDLSLLPHHPHWQNYILAWKEGGFGRNFFNSIIYTASVVFGRDGGLSSSARRGPGINGLAELAGHRDDPSRHGNLFESFPVRRG